MRCKTRITAQDKWHPNCCHVAGGQAAFTLIELLVTVAVIALLLAVLVPSLSRARRTAMSAACLSNLRQFAAAAHSYAQNHQARFPVAQYMVMEASRKTWYKWDFTTVADKTARSFQTRPGLLWSGRTNEQIHQCPGFRGSANAVGGTQGANAQPTEPYTGYNYNTSYIGHGQGEVGREQPAQIGEVRQPAACALFGDGEYSDGANKFMRAPWDDVAFCDGHALSWPHRYTETEVGDQELIAPGTGFLSPDNRLYDLK